MAEILVAREPFSCTSKSGVPRIFSAGQQVYSDDPDVKGREHLFEPASARLDRLSGRAARATETATAAPGEHRTRSKRTTSKEAGDDKQEA